MRGIGFHPRSIGLLQHQRMKATTQPQRYAIGSGAGITAPTQTQSSSCRIRVKVFSKCMAKGTGERRTHAGAGIALMSKSLPDPVRHLFRGHQLLQSGWVLKTRPQTHTLIRCLFHVGFLDMAIAPDRIRVVGQRDGGLQIFTIQC